MPKAKRPPLKRLMVRLTVEQVAALHAEALRRARERGSFKPDASELVREAVEAWMRRKRP